MREFTLKENIDLDTFLKEHTLNYGFADYLSEKSRLEDVLQRQVDYIEEQQDAEYATLIDPELIQIFSSKDTYYHVLAIVNKQEFPYDTFFEGIFEDDDWNDDTEE